MMNKPSIIDLQKKVKCRYMLVSIVAKRARQLVGQDELLNNQKAVSYAVNELKKAIPLVRRTAAENRCMAGLWERRRNTTPPARWQSSG